MSLLLDHPFFDAIGLGVDAKSVGLPKPSDAKLDVHEPHENPWQDTEARVEKIVHAPHAHGPLILLEYRSGDDPELNFIPKTIAGFASGALLLGICLNLGLLLLVRSARATMDLSAAMAYRSVFVVGITGVAASLLLVGLKVRADHSPLELHSRHWLNSICTGALFSLLVWGPWLAIERGIHIDRFIVAFIWMLLFFFPIIAARWTVAPAKHPDSPIPSGWAG